MQTSGLILDLYDDFQGDVLSTIYSSDEEVPDMVKSAQRLEDNELHALPDDVFALVALADGNARMRKYACTDPGNTVLSVEYFLKTAHKLPAEAQKQAANNLVTACGWYSLQPPAELLKCAGLGLAMGALSAVPLAQGAHDEAKQNIRNIKAAPPGKVVNPFKKHAQGAAAGAPMPTMGAGQPSAAMAAPPPPIQQQAPMAMMGQQSAPTSVAGAPAGAPPMTAQPTPKMAEAALTEVMPASSTNMSPTKKKAPIKLAGSGCAGKRAKLKAAMMKKAEIGHLIVNHGSETDEAPQTETDPSASAERQVHEKVFRQGLDLRGKKQETKQTEKEAQYVALGRYPMDSFEQIKAASAYFEEWSSKLPPEHRREFCQVLVKRADAIGRPGMVSYDARKYGSSTYAPAGEVKMAMDMRKGVLNDFEAHRVLDGLFAKMATVRADIFCEALNQFDQDYGLNHQYGGHVPDPFWSTYGFRKTAMTEEKEDELQSVGTETISKNKIVDSADPSHANNILVMLQKRFGIDFRNEWQKDPVGIFSSLPIEQKIFIVRFINDNGVSPAAVEM